jgi:signal transduction histidine kinase
MIDYIPKYGVEIYPFGFVFILAFLSVIGYAIVRYKLMDIEVIIKKTLVFAGLLASVFAMLILPTLIIQEYLFRGTGTGGRMAGLAISGIVIILTMHRIEAFLINVTDKYLFQKKYDYKELLKTFTAEVLTVLELDNLVNLTVDKLSDIVKLTSSAVLLFDEEKQQFNVMASRGVKDPTVTLIRPDGIVTFMEETHGYILIKELNDKKIMVPESVKEIIARLSAELIIPMVLHEEVMGMLSLGKKKSDEDYTQDDLDILLPLAKTLAIAISNAKLFDELGKTQAEAAQKEKMAVIGTLSAGINHEICNPLGIARGQCEAFLLNLKDGLYKTKSAEELLERSKEIMAKVIKETDRATAITKKLSGFAKPSKGESELVDISKELDEVQGLVGYELKLEKIEFVKDIEKDLPNIFVDKKQLQEVLFNLVRNAGQAIGEKGRITVSVRQKDRKVFIDIQDTGSGIPEDKVHQLFNPFFTTKEPGKGTGLGLFIVRQVVERSGGRIYLKQTKVGEGTTFTLEFPIASEEPVTQP